VEGIPIKVAQGLINLIIQGFEVLKREFELDNASFCAKLWLLLVEFKPVQSVDLFSFVPVAYAPVFSATLTLLQKPVVLVKFVDKWVATVEVSQWELIGLWVRVDVVDLVAYQLVNLSTVCQMKFQLIRL
jgi:hypothetical protein